MLSRNKPLGEVMRSFVEPEATHVLPVIPFQIELVPISDQCVWVQFVLRRVGCFDHAFSLGPGGTLSATKREHDSSKQKYDDVIGN